MHAAKMRREYGHSESALQETQRLHSVVEPGFEYMNAK